ncbi:MAG: hypothetical protein PQJ61_10530 [Spirochaetales bacterium]|uniref:Outer membrane protein beta-barrel domain-containing protein n=1 Tax=Candidatus Thalassospirochaeta sargassi TaxID=3119039 RepID=A0AAJ1ID99_9SPIO|nr:hypothetical protein [Spirochaetales bacterium]
MPVFSQEDEPADDDYAGIAAFTRGEQLFSLNAGAIFPLFTLAPFHEDDEPLVGTLSSTHTGVSGSLKLGFFVRDNLMLGGELAGMYAATDNSSLTMIPITFVTQYYFLKYPFEFPIYINVGVSMNSFDDYFRITPLIKPGAGAYYNINGEWALGLNFDYWFMPELYFNTYKNETRIANFLQISLSGVYHF